MTPKKFDVFGIGQCALDYIGVIKKFPDSDEKCEFHNLVIQGGGPVATALVALQRWGFRCAFGGIVGDDDFGREILRDLKHEQVDISGVIVRPAGASQFAFSLAEPDTGNRTIFWRRPTGDPLQIKEISMERLASSKLVLTDGIFPEATIALCKIARKKGVKIVVDAGSLRPGMTNILHFSDYFIASETFARAYMPGASMEEVCRALSDCGPVLSAVTMGKRGYTAFYKNTLLQEPAYTTEVMDTTGCGDIFHAGFIYGLLHSWRIERALQFAAWAAAMVSRYPGGRTGIPDPDDWPEQDFVQRSPSEK